MNYLVTGGAGFLGSHLIDRLLKEDDNKVTVIDGHSDRIVVVDNFDQGKYVNLPKDRRLTVYNADILGDIGHLFKDIDIVFHLAALTRPQWSIKYPFETNQVNVDGTIRILEHSRDHKIKRVVFVSSSNLYGEQSKYPTAETATPNPLNAYALSKLVGEQYCKLFEKLYGLESNYIRPFNAYGSRMPLTGIYTSAVATFIDVLKKNLPLQMNGDGEQRRDFIYIDDVIEALLLITQNNKKSNTVINVGSGEYIKIKELAEKIKNLTKSSSKIIYKDFDPGLKNSYCNNSLLKSYGWKQKTSMDEGLKKTIEWIKENEDII